MPTNSPARPDSPSRPDLEVLKVLSERLTAKEHRGQYTLGGCIVRTDGTSESWGGKKILVARNPDGATADAAITSLIAHVERLEKALKPFADACNISTADDSDSIYDTLASEKITWRDLRLARATLSQGTSHE